MLAASVDQAEAGCRTRIYCGQAEHRSVRTWKGASRRGSAVARGLLACSAPTFTGSRHSIGQIYPTAFESTIANHRKVRENRLKSQLATRFCRLGALCVRDAPLVPL